MTNTLFILAPWQTVAGDSEVVRYKLNTTQPVWQETIDFLDAITDKDFVRVYDDNFDLSISHAPMPWGVGGRADYLDGDLYNGHFDIGVDPRQTGGTNSDFYQYVAMHELGHAMGLKHPHDGLFTNYDLTDTIMSYTPDNYAFSYLDRAALVAVNGIEDDVPQVYRMYNKNTGSHFYTADAQEAEWVVTTMYNDFAFDGTAFEFGDGTIEIHRYYNHVSGAHFYTTDRSEIKSGWTNFEYEGVSFHVDTEGEEVHRLLNTNNNTHFYTSSEEEIAGLPDFYVYEGVAFYV